VDSVHFWRRRTLPRSEKLLTAEPQKPPRWCLVEPYVSAVKSLLVLGKRIYERLDIGFLNHTFVVISEEFP
jgi:hypothetical protein